MKTIDDLINFIKEELREAREVDEDFIRAESYEYVLEAVEEFKENMEKASIPVPASFVNQCIASVEIIESGNTFQKEFEEYINEQIKNLEEFLSTFETNPLKDCLNRGWYEGQKTAYENVLKKLNNMEKDDG